MIDIEYYEEDELEAEFQTHCVRYEIPKEYDELLRQGSYKTEDSRLVYYPYQETTKRFWAYSLFSSFTLGFVSWLMTDRNGNEVYHRTDGPAWIEERRNRWYQYGKTHREDGPAEIYHDVMYWIISGFSHREDGPAIISVNHVANNTVVSGTYCLYGKTYPFSKYAKIITELNKMSPEEQELYRSVNWPNLSFVDKQKELDIQGLW